MGKSQLAFALNSDRPYFYWLATSVDQNSQAMYQNFALISHQFNKFVQRDDATKQAEGDILNTTSLFYQENELWTFGFIRALLGHSKNYQGMIHFSKETKLQVSKCKVSDVKATISEMENDQKKLPFFYLG